MLCATVHHREDEELEVPAPKALDTKDLSANRGILNTECALHQTKNRGLLIKLKQKSQHKNAIQFPGAQPSVVHFNGTEAQPANQPELL